ncbi:hypothetical protein SAMN06265379_104269 [Saccharicrinis carchari]|uniref:Uncharacterized protein n=1 Tax=Saccharicrinis carchari TaxID=1168039 RepID=A0A521D5L6_SACCC|nr:hypothetical protein SAMN06265379_104269 [Saccharicrinis carchari]
MSNFYSDRIPFTDITDSRFHFCIFIHFMLFLLNIYTCSVFFNKKSKYFFYLCARTKIRGFCVLLRYAPLPY